MTVTPSVSEGTELMKSQLRFTRRSQNVKRLKSRSPGTMGLMEAQKVTPVIDRSYALSEVPELSGVWQKDTLEGK